MDDQIEKAYADEKSTVMDEHKIFELKLRDDIKYNFSVYTLEELDTEDEINEGLNILRDLNQKFRHAHIELKNLLGDKYEEIYTDYDKYFKEFVTFTKNARKRLRTLKQNKVKAEVETGKTSAGDEMKQKLKIDEDLLAFKINQLNESVDINLVMNIEPIDDYISKMEGFLQEKFDLNGKLRFVYGERYTTSENTKFEEVIFEMNQDIKMAKILKQKIIEFLKNNNKTEAENSSRSNNVLIAKNLCSEINLRCKSLRSIYDVDLKSFSDYQILEISQKNVDHEFNGILEKVTSLAALVPLGGKAVQNLLKTAGKHRDLIASKRKLFQEDLQKIVIERDVTPDKLKNATVLKIELPKFCGYDGKMDIFTFKSEFHKLVEPIVQKQYWADYLKRNYLSGSALILVKKETDYSRIWDKLFESYGNARFLLQNKLSDLDSIGGLWKIRGEEKITNAIASLINNMKELSDLADEHKIEGQLYEGGGLEKIMNLIGDHRHRKFREKNLGPTFCKKVEWVKLVEFLQRELKLRERLTLDHKCAQLMGINQPKNDAPRGGRGDKQNLYTGVNLMYKDGDPTCHICEKTGHTVITTTKGNKIVPYYVCENFVKMSPAERFSTLKSKNLCTGCLFPGAEKGPNHKCFYTRYCCPHPSHEKEKIHVLLCEKHKKDGENLKVLEKFKETFIKKCKVELPTYSKHLACFSEMVGVTNSKKNLPNACEIKCAPDVNESAIFGLQTIEVEGIRLNLFFDNGCGDLVLKKSAVDKLASIGRAKQVIPGPLEITGVGDLKSVSEDGVYSVCLPLRNKNSALLSGICLPKITSKFPKYNLEVIENEIRDKSKQIGGQELVDKLPRLPHEVGGETDILIGVKYLKYFPKLVFELETGLGIYDSVFESSCGTTGVISGPHREFSSIEREHKGLHVGEAAYFETSVLYFRKISNNMPMLGFRANPSMSEIDAPLCCSFQKDDVRIVDEAVDEVNGADGADGTDGDDEKQAVPLVCAGCECEAKVMHGKRSPKCAKQFDEIEKAGTEVIYRCVDCRACLKCKNGMKFDAVSIQEEVEQAIIERSVEVDLEKNMTKSKLPFLVDPDTRLVPNESSALMVFQKQVKLLNLKPSDKAAVIEFEKKLQDMGFVDYVSNLDDDMKNEIMSNIIKYFIPWRAVWNEKSLSTPCRMVFDASMGTKNGCSLNSLLAKGTNSLNKLVEILIRWQIYMCAFHTDVTKMYNRIFLDESFWRYQLYLWADDLVENSKPVWKVIKTLIYGVRSSGNLAECGLRRTAELSKNEFPRAYEVVMHDTYMDDCISGDQTPAKTKTVTDNLEVSLAKGGFSLKGFTFSGEDPPENLSSDGESVLVGGLRWFPKGDFIKLNLQELNFNKKFRGRRPGNKDGVIPEKITKRDCVKVVSEVFDPLGKVAPIIGGMKIDISVLHQRHLDWDDPIPNELKNVWAANFDLIKEIGTLQFQRAIVPENACNLEIETIGSADAGEHLVCAAIHARFKLRDGGHSCQLIFARTKIVHDITIPRAELVAALLNASTGHVVRLSLKYYFKKSWKLTDSEVVLHWINSTKTALKMYVRNRVIEIMRLTDRSDWWYVSSANNVADIGTRKGAKIKDVKHGSPWTNGYSWMSDSEENFPIQSIHDIILSNKEKCQFDKERVIDESHAFLNEQCLTKYVPNELGERYKFSRYIIDPNRFRFRTVIRVLGLVFLFITKCNKKRFFDFMKKREFSEKNTKSIGRYFIEFPINVKPSTNVAVVHLSENLIAASKMYYFRKATLEIQHFLSASKYENNSVLHDGILYYTGRILPSQKVDGKHALSDVCLDLSVSSFCVPMTDSLSPIAYAVVDETHWYHPDVSHGGVESILRFSQATAHIIGGRELVKSHKKACVQCRILHKKGVRVAMGPIGESNLCIAPPFFYCQVDLCGPMSAYSPVNKRATLKIWYVVFCCTTTSVVDIRVMENYTADSFLQAFERFSCRFGYPKTVLPDEGSQLVKGCQGMVISFSDIKHKMSREYGIDFKTCPVGAHNVHGKVERKIREIRRSIRKNVEKHRLSVLQWETLGQQISNAMNNTPIGLGNKTEMIENLDILTPNRLILGRNNNRCPTEPLQIENDLRRIVESNNKLFEVWFREWLTSCVPSLIERPKWFVTERHVCVNDVVLFLKSDKEFDRQYQYGIVASILESRDGHIRFVTVEYQNHGENVKRHTKRSVRDLVVVHPIDELGISKELYDFVNSI